MKKILVVLLSLLVVGAVFGAQTSADGEIPVEVKILTHYELTITEGSAFQFTLDPENPTNMTDDVAVNVKANDYWTMNTDFVVNSDDFPTVIQEYNWDLQDVLNAVVTLDDDASGEPGDNTVNITMGFNYADFTSPENPWYDHLATTSENGYTNLVDNFVNAGKVTVTIGAEYTAVE